jgi:predicted phage terminase large subunit-like protein
MAIVLKPQPGPQERFLATSADVCIYGGAAGGGKSYALLLSPLRYKNTKDFTCTIFRKNFKQIFSQGGLWDESWKIYSPIKGAVRKLGDASWTFHNAKGEPTARVSFAHIERFEEVESWQGSQIAFIGFDEVTHFDEKTFFYMLSRNRSTCGVKPFIRATCNPDADSWVARFIEWWIDQDTGYPIPERSGKLRWFFRKDDELYWGNSRSELIEEYNLRTPEELLSVKSATFIASSVYDNKILLQNDPAYLGNLLSLATVERERLLKGNWKIKPSAGLYFKRVQVGSFLPVIPDDVLRWVRCWDLAATTEDENGNAAYTAGVLIGKRKNGRYVIADVVNKQMNAADVRNTILHTAQQDIAKYKRVRIRIPQDPGQAGKEQAQSYIKFLSGFDVTAVPESGSKVDRATPMSAQWQAGNFDIVVAPWNEPYLSQLENFPDGKLKDMVDASANGFNEIELRSQFNLSHLV